MKDYVRILRYRDYRLLWSGATISSLGDGATWTALAWLAITQGGAAAAGVLAICYTFPVIAGGTFIGPMIDRFSRRHLLVFDSVLRAIVVASVPLVAATGHVGLWQLDLVAATYGLLKIVPLGAVPAVVPDLVDKKLIHTAAGLESIGFEGAQMAGPAIGGLLIAVWSAPTVLLLDAITYLIFAGCVLAMKSKLPRPESSGSGNVGGLLKNFGWGPVFRLLRKDSVLLGITASFALYNAAMGMLRVTQPWLAADKLTGGATILGIILGVANGAGLIGSVLAGAIRPRDRHMRNIGLFQVAAGLGLAFMFLPTLWAVVIAMVISNVFSAPMTVQSQVLRVSRTPADLRGRMMTFMRTLMNSTSPGGAAVAAPLLAAGRYFPVIAIMVTAAVLPGLFIAFSFRKTSFSEELGLAPSAVAEPSPAKT